jgi:cell division septum initiation protein DivIVA
MVAVTDAALRKADELLSELIELVETARALPMSSSCVVPREQVLDLLDALRETMPPEMSQARSIVARRDSIEAEARSDADELLASARGEGERLVHAARIEAHEGLEAARAEAAQLVSASSIHYAAVEESAQVRADAESYATSLRASSEDYAQRTLADLAALLSQAAQTAENGRQQLLRRVAGEQGAPDPQPEGASAGDIVGEAVESGPAVVDVAPDPSQPGPSEHDRPSEPDPAEAPC